MCTFDVHNSKVSGGDQLLFSTFWLELGAFWGILHISLRCKPQPNIMLILSLSFSHTVDETTTDIICIKCKKDNSDSPNEIVLCDMCGIGG